MRSNAKTPEDYIKEAGAERGPILTSLRTLIQNNLQEGFEEVINWGMITYQVPLATYPNTYNKQPMVLAGLANQKNYLSLYLSMPGGLSQVKEAATRAGKNLKTGTSCINFKKLDELPLETIKEVFQKNDLKSFLTSIEQALQRTKEASPTKKTSAKKSATTKASAKAKKPAKKTSTKKATKPAAKKAKKSSTKRKA